MGGALWVFLWLWRESTACDSPHVREVRGGRSFRAEEIAQALGQPLRSIERHLATLRTHGYLQTWKEQHGISALVNLWAGESSAPPEMAGQDQSSTAKNGGTESETGPVPPKMAGLEAMSPAKNGGTEIPPGPPYEVLEELSLDHASNLRSSGPCLIPQPCIDPVPTTAKIANVVPLRPEPPGPGSPRAAAGVRGSSPREQAILHHLGRIDAWERPELTKTLSRTLWQLPPAGLNEVFELAWTHHRLRNKALDNPPGWWVATLTRLASAWLKVKQEDEANG